MKKLSILLVFVLLFGCLFLVACGGNGDNGDGTGNGGQEGGGEQSGGEGQGGGEEANGYTIIVKDQFGNAMTGVNLQICHGDLSLGNCLKPKDVDENGKAFYSYSGTLENARVQINSVPENVEKPTDYIFFENDSKTLEITLRRITKITVNATDEAGNKLAYINVSVNKVGSGVGGLVETKETNSEGVCEFTIDAGLYSLYFEAKNDSYKLTNGDSENSSIYTLKEGENSFTAIFSQSTEAISYSITLKDSDGNPLKDVVVSFYSMEYAKLTSVTTDINGKAETSLVNGDYFAVAEVEATKNAQTYIFVKNNTNKGEITVYDTQAGVNKFNAIMIVGQKELTVGAGETQWIYVYNPNGESVLFVNNEGLTITGDGKFSDNTFTFEEIDGNKGYIKVVNDSQNDVTYTAIIDEILVPTPYN